MQEKSGRLDALRRAVLPPAMHSFEASDWQILSKHWYPVAWAHEVAGVPVPVTLLDVRLVLYRIGQEVVVALDRCPHRGVPLSRGRLVGDVLVCAYHGLQFDACGQCRHIPAHPQLQPGSRFDLLRFPVTERFGLIWTCLVADAEPALPELPEWDDAAYERIMPPSLDIGGSSARQVEGFIDVAHFAFVHSTAFADPDNQWVPAYATEQTENGLRTLYFSHVSNYPKDLQHLAPQDYRWLREYLVYLPFSAKLIVHFPDDQRYHILNASSPVSARQTPLFVPIARNFSTLGSVESVLAFNAQIFAEDKVIVESQEPVSLDAAAQVEESFAADKPSVFYRRRLAGMGLRFA